jgi:hypothetical protein
MSRKPGLGKIRMSIAAFDNLSKSAKKEAQSLRRALDQVKFSSPVPNTRRSLPRAPAASHRRTVARGTKSRFKKKRTKSLLKKKRTKSLFKKKRTKKKRVGKSPKRTKRRKRKMRKTRRKKRGGNHSGFFW